MSIRQIWRETAALFWEYPVLWLPVLGADLLSFFLTRLEKNAARQVIYHLLLGPASVFGDTRSFPGPSSDAPFGKAAAVGGLFEWSMHFTQIVLYTTAFFMTAALVRKVSRQATEFLPSLMQSLRSRWRAIFGLSLRVLGVVAPLAISFGALIAFTIAQTQKYMVRPPRGAMYVLIVPAFCGMAYFVAPIAMRRIDAMALKPLTAESKRNGRIFAVLAVVVSSFLGYCLPFIETSFIAEPFFGNSSAIAILGAIVSLVTAIPYVVLFIALTLIVDGDAAASESVENLAGGNGQEGVIGPS
jgi:hypothetical protein